MSFRPLLLPFAFLFLAQAARADKVIQFGGEQWTVRDSELGGPGPNRWSEDNVWLDRKGRLHFKITPPAVRGGKWSCAEIYTDKAFGFGHYQWTVVGRPDLFDPQIVLGLFNYPAPAMGPDGTNEIDIEFARWGKATHPNGNYTIWPALPGKSAANIGQTFEYKLSQPISTHYFDWSSGEIEFWSHDGRDKNSPLIGNYKYVSPQAEQEIPQQKLPLHLNLWLYAGKAPQNGKAVEIVISEFSFVPSKIAAK